METRTTAETQGSPRRGGSHKKVDAEHGQFGQAPRGKDHIATLKGAKPLSTDYWNNLCMVDNCNQVATSVCDGKSGCFKGCHRKMCVLHTLRRGAASSDVACTAEDCMKRHTCCRRFETTIIVLAVLIVLAGLAALLYWLITGEAPWPFN